MPSPHNARLATDTQVVQRAGEQHRLVQPVGAGKQDHGRGKGNERVAVATNGE